VGSDIQDGKIIQHILWHGHISSKWYVLMLGHWLVSCFSSSLTVLSQELYVEIFGQLLCHRDDTDMASVLDTSVFPTLTDILKNSDW